MIPQPVVTELDRLIREGWTGKLELDFKDGRIALRVAKVARSEKTTVRVD